MQIFSSRLTELNEKEVRRYARAEKMPQKLIDEAILDALIYINPQGIFNIFDYDYKNSNISFENKRIFLSGNSIKKHLDFCEKVAILSLTIGEDIEKEITHLSEIGEYSHALLLDAAATEAVEEAADLMEKVIKREAERDGFYITSRFSPGYGDFPITMQNEILELSAGKNINISLSSSLMLIPRKSITAIIGFKRENSTSNKKDCKNCNKLDCNFRNKGE